MSFTNIEKALQIILRDKDQPIESYPQTCKELVDKINQELNYILKLVNTECDVAQNYLDGNITKEEKTELINDALIDTITTNRHIKEIVLTLQEKVLNLNTLIKTTNITDENVVSDKLINEIKDCIYNISNDELTLVELKVVCVKAGKYNCIIKLLLTDLTPNKIAHISELIDTKLIELGKVVENLNYTVLPNNTDGTYNSILNFKIS